MLDGASSQPNTFNLKNNSPILYLVEIWVSIYYLFLFGI